MHSEEVVSTAQFSTPTSFTVAPWILGNSSMKDAVASNFAWKWSYMPVPEVPCDVHGATARDRTHCTPSRWWPVARQNVYPLLVAIAGAAPRQQQELRRTTQLVLTPLMSLLHVTAVLKGVMPQRLCCLQQQLKGVTPQSLWLRWYQRLWLRWYWRQESSSALVRSQTNVGPARDAQVFSRPNQPMDQERSAFGAAYRDSDPLHARPKPTSTAIRPFGLWVATATRPYKLRQSLCLRATGGHDGNPRQDK